jgi:hypothetical protein
MPNMEAFRLQPTYTAYFIELPEGVLPAILENDDVRTDLKFGLRKLPGVDNVELDDSTGEGVVYLTIDIEHDGEEARAVVARLLATAAEAVAKPSAPKP